jgi:hypothetical protein
MPLGIVLSAVYRIGAHLVGFVDVPQLQGRTRSMIVIRMDRQANRRKAAFTSLTSAAGVISSTA